MASHHVRESLWAMLWAAIFAVPAAAVYDHVKDGSIWMGWTWKTFWSPDMVRLTEMWAGTTLFILLVKQWRRWKDRSRMKQSQTNQEIAEHLMKHDPQDLTP
jgi:hypothetical protein